MSVEQKIEFYKNLINEAINFEYAEKQLNNIWEVIAWDETLSDDKIDELGDYITSNSNLHFSM